MRFEVPQFIELEDKIIGPFTWKQFVYLAGGAGGAIIILLVFGVIVFALIGLPFLVLAGLLAFYPINNRPFSLFLESVLNYYRSNKYYYWRKKADVVYRDKTDKVSGPDSGYELTKIQTSSNSGINSLSRKLEMQSLEPK